MRQLAVTFEVGSKPYAESGGKRINQKTDNHKTITRLDTCAHPYPLLSIKRHVPHTASITPGYTNSSIK